MLKKFAFFCTILLMLSPLGASIAGEDLDFSYDSSAQPPTVVTPDPVLWQQTETTSVAPEPAVEPEAVPSQGKLTDAGIQMIFTGNNKLIIIPLSYVLPFAPMGGVLSLNAGVPYVSRTYVTTGGDQTVSGLGDISLGSRLDYGDEVYFRLLSELILKFATGDTGKSLGRGSTDIAVAFTLIRKMMEYRLIGHLGYRMNGSFENDLGLGTGEIDYGNILSFLIGAEREVRPQMQGFLKLRGVSAGESDITTTFFGTTSVNGAADDMFMLDLIPGIRYQVMNAVSVVLGIEIPISTSLNSNIQNPPSRQVAVNIKGDYRF